MNRYQRYGMSPRAMARFIVYTVMTKCSSLEESAPCGICAFSDNCADDNDECRCLDGVEEWLKQEWKPRKKPQGIEEKRNAYVGRAIALISDINVYGLNEDTKERSEKLINDIMAELSLASKEL